jgi:hypothetical protein
MQRVTSLMLVTDNAEEMLDHLKTKRGEVLDISKPVTSKLQPDMNQYSDKSGESIRGKAVGS